MGFSPINLVAFAANTMTSVDVVFFVALNTFFKFSRPHSTFNLCGCKSKQWIFFMYYYAVVPRVIRCVYYFEIFNSIIQRVMIYVVNMFTSFKLSTNLFFHKNSMFVFPSSFSMPCFNDPIKQILSRLVLSFGADWVFFQKNIFGFCDHFFNFILGPFNFGWLSSPIFNLEDHRLPLFLYRFWASFMPRLERRLIGASHAYEICHSGG